MAVALSNSERQEQILQILSRQQRISVGEICAAFAVSEATARRDLETLANLGKIQRIHGGAVLFRQAPPEAPILQRQREQAAEKMRIGLAAASLIQDGETIFLGSGSTVLEVAHALRTRHLTVITNSLPVMNALAGLPNIHLISLGGELRQSELSFIGHITEQALQEVRADKVLMGIRAISLEHGLTNDYLPETLTDRAILRIAREIILLADHTKFGRVATAFVAPLENIHTLITDAKTPAEFIQALRERGIRVIVT
ncbi:MAG: DeoR/GlpR family DNA-binding transcription regulator [Anaerolineales bacterium]